MPDGVPSEPQQPSRGLLDTQILDAWMADNAFVTWTVTQSPWDHERLIRASEVSLPLNIRDNPQPGAITYLQQVRSVAVRAALALEIVADSGGRERLLTFSPRIRPEAIFS